MSTNYTVNKDRSIDKYGLKMLSPNSQANIRIKLHSSSLLSTPKKEEDYFESKMKQIEYLINKKYFKDSIEIYLQLIKNIIKNKEEQE